MENFSSTYPQAKTFNGSVYEHDSKTGLSQFQLTTINEIGGMEYAIGLLNELPEFTFSVEYTDGPGTVWQDLLSSFFTNDLMQTINMLGATRGNESWTNFVKAGSWSKKVYNGYKPGNIALKFRIYEEDSLGQSSVKHWVDLLTKYATINGKAKYSSSQALDNFKNAVQNAYNTGETVGQQNSTILLDSLFTQNDNQNTMGGEESAGDYTSKLQLKQQKAAAMYQTLTNTILMNSTYEDLGNHNKSYLFLEADDTGKGDIKLELVFRTNNYVKEELFGSNRIATTGKVNIGAVNPEDENNIDDITFDKIKIDEFFQKAKTLKGNSAEQTSLMQRHIDYIQKEFNDKYETKQNDAFGMDEFDKLNVLIKNVTQAGSLAVGKYTNTRVVGSFNRNNSFGEKLWYLNIYNDVIFKNTSPLIVYISDWTVKYSEECYAGGKPMYTDFTITCCLDQVYSRKTWYSMLVDDILNMDMVENTNLVQQDEEDKRDYAFMQSFNPATATKQDKMKAQKIVKTKVDGIWGPNSIAAYKRYMENHK